jgi:hypothetical protein
LAVILEFFNLIVPIDVIKSKYPGGWEQCLKDHEHFIDKTVWYDDYLFRDGAMSGHDIGDMVDYWVQMGFEATEVRNGKTIWKDLCVIDELGGVAKYPCDWVSYEPVMRTAYLNGSTPNNLVRRKQLPDSDPEYARPKRWPVNVEEIKRLISEIRERQEKKSMSEKAD